MNNETYTLITGASNGLGKELAKECALRGHNLLLTALPGEDIENLGRSIASGSGIKVHTFETDFTENEAVEKLANSSLGNYRINMLINNAGIGGTIPFLQASPAYIDRMVMLNTRALVVLTRLLLPELKNHPKSYILNIASMASFGPIPFKTVYPASKAFVYSFSRGLGAELKGTGVSVSVAHPGGMKTNPEVTRRIEQHSRFIQATTLPPEKVARICIRETLKGNRLIIPGTMNKLSWLILKLVPVWLRLIIMRNSLQNELGDSKNIIQPA